MQKIKFITKEDVLELMENKEDFKLVDSLSAESFKKGHILGSINIPVQRIEELAPELLPNKDQLIVVYCASYTCQTSTGAVRALNELGYTNVLDYKGGKKDWDEAGIGLVTI
ncbi:sulfurtransferase [Candidatus Wolfebacteria bacterium]|nr:MAG: sulfurtransferase [Candidatus Wolfebacteria bacterium]